MDLNFHPMCLEERPIIPIRPHNRLGDSLSLALEFGRPSIRMSSCSRAGKSTGVGVVSCDVSWRPHNLGFLSTICGNPDRHTESALFRDMAFGLNLRLPKNMTGTDSLVRIARAVEEEAGRSNARTVVIAFDNAELLQLDDYEHLARLQQMFSRSPRLFFMFVCQTDARPEGSDSLEATAPPHIKGRFFVDRHEFTGLLWNIPDQDKPTQDVNDVALALRQFDLFMRWPGTSGPSFTQAFAPLAYEDGFRLENQLPLFVKCIEEVNKAANLAQMPDWLLASFEPFVYYLLVRVAGANPAFSAFTENDVMDALRVSAFAFYESSRQGVRR